MKKTIVILSIILSLFSLSSCNLDNEGILWRNIDRTVSDNKNRNFIGATDDAFYFVTENGLEKGTVNGDSYSETVVSTNDIFAQFYQDFGFIYETDNIIYLDDVAGKSQTFYLIDLTTNEISQLQCDVSGISFKDHYLWNNNDYLIGTDGNNATKVYSVSVFGEELLTLTPLQEALSGYNSSYNGLIYTGSEYVYNGKTVKVESGDEAATSFTSTDVESFAASDYSASESDYYIIRNNGSSFYIYKSKNSTDVEIIFEQIASVSGSYTRPFTSFVADGKLCFVDANGTNSASQFITVSTNPDAEGNYTVTRNNTVNGMEAEAFFTLNDSTTYMLSKNHGLFKVENTSLVKL